MPFDNPTAETAVQDSPTTTLLRAAWALIDAPEKWTQHTMARPRLMTLPRQINVSALIMGTAIVDLEEITYHTTMTYCSVGALHHVADELSTAARLAAHHLHAALPSGARRKPHFLDGVLHDLISFNDDVHWPTVKRWWQRAIALSVEHDRFASQRSL